MNEQTYYAGPWPTSMPVYGNGKPVPVQLMAWAAFGAIYHGWPWGCAEPAWWDQQ